MRTTLTLDEDVAAALQRACREQKRPWKEVVNEVLRSGIVAREARALPQGYAVEPHPSGRLLMPSQVVATHDLLAWAEGDGYK